MVAKAGRSPGRAWRRVTYGVWEDDAPRTPLEALGGWALVLPSTTAFTHLSACAAYGWWLPSCPPAPVFVALPASVARPRRPGLKVCRHPVQPATRLVQGVRLAEPPETLLAAARDLAVLDLVVLVDSALAAGDVSLDELDAATRSGRRGAPALRSVLPLSDGRSESPWESVMRVLHHSAEIPVTPQQDIFDIDGTFIARADLLIDGTRRIHEYDGAVHRTPEAQDADLTRSRALSQAHWDRHGFTSRHLLRDGARIIRSTDELLGRAWDVRRFRAWEALLNASALRRPGWERLRARWTAEVR